MSLKGKRYVLSIFKALHALREATYRIIAHLPHYFSNLSNCEQIVLFLLGTLPMALAVRQGQKESTS